MLALLLIQVLFRLEQIYIRLVICFLHRRLSSFLNIDQICCTVPYSLDYKQCIPAAIYCSGKASFSWIASFSWMMAWNVGLQILPDAGKSQTYIPYIYKQLFLSKVYSYLSQYCVLTCPYTNFRVCIL